MDWQLITSYNEWGEGTSVESALDWQTESGFGMYLDVLHQYATVEDLTTSDTYGSSQPNPIDDLPFTISNKILQIDQRAAKVIVYSITGRVILVGEMSQVLSWN